MSKFPASNSGPLLPTTVRPPRSRGGILKDEIVAILQDRYARDEAAKIAAAIAFHPQLSAIAAVIDRYLKP